MAYAYPGVSVTPVRAKLCQLLADIVPGDINSFIFPSSGSEANECAMRMARLYTGRHKIFARYRSYHGGTLGSMGLTGDQRRWPTEPFSSNGIVHFFDPFPYSFSKCAQQPAVVLFSVTFVVLCAVVISFISDCCVCCLCRALGAARRRRSHPRA
jgi:taurine--2-oxoglutarate transaminase